MSAPEPFAKLFDTEFGQLLVTMDSDEEQGGPCLSIRAATVQDVTPAIKHGPWPDDDASWDHVATLLSDFDQAQADEAAQGLTEMVRNLMS